MKIKSILAVILAVMLVASLAACSGGGSGGSSGSGDNPVTIEFMGWEASPLETEAVKNGIAEFERQFPHIKVDYIVTPAAEDFHARLLAQFAGGEAPDVFFMGDSSYRQYAARDVLLEITDKFDATYSFDDFLPSSRRAMDINGKVFGIQSCIVTPVMYYNKDIFDAAGVAYPPTTSMSWEEFREKAIAVTSGDVIGSYGIESSSWQQLPTLMISIGAPIYNNDLTASTINTPQARTVINAIRDLRVVDGAAADAVTLENVGMNAAQMLQTGRIAMLTDGSWALQELATMGFNYGLAPMPNFGKPSNVAAAHMHSIKKDTPYPDEAWEFLKFLSGMDYQGALVASGLWMPNRLSMYEPEMVEQWYNEDIHREYIEFLDYFKNADCHPWAIAQSSMMGDILVEELDVFYRDGGDLEEILPRIEQRVNEEIARVARESS